MVGVAIVGVAEVGAAVVSRIVVSFVSKAYLLRGYWVYYACWSSAMVSCACEVSRWKETPGRHRPARPGGGGTAGEVGEVDVCGGCHSLWLDRVSHP